MALPQAQLGQMGSASAPHQLQTQVIHKEPKAWERALLTLLSNAGSAVMQQGIANAMQPDYAPQPAGLGQKFLSGPTISAARAGELDRQVIDKEKSSEAARQSRLDRMLALTGQNKSQALAYGTQALAADREAGDLEHNRATEDLALVGLKQQGAHQRLQDLVAQINKERQARVGDAQIKEIGAQTEERLAKAAQMKLQNQMMEEAASGGKRPAAAVNPNVARFAATSGTATPTVAEVDPIATMVDQGLPLDEIRAILEKQSAIRNQADAQGEVDAATASRRQQTIDEIRRRLGLRVDSDVAASLPGFLN